MQASLFDQAILYYMPCLWPHCFTNERPRLMAPAQLGRVVRHDAHAVVHRHNHPNKPRRRGHCGLVECSRCPTVLALQGTATSAYSTPKGATPARALSLCVGYVVSPLPFNGCRVSYTIPGTPGKKTGIVDDTRD